MFDANLNTARRLSSFGGSLLFMAISWDCGTVILRQWNCDFSQNSDFAKIQLLQKWSKEAGTAPWGTHWRRDCGRLCLHSQAQPRHGSPPPFLFSHSIVRHALNVVFKCPWCYDHILTLVYLQKNMNMSANILKVSGGNWIFEQISLIFLEVSHDAQSQHSATCHKLPSS